MLWIKAFHIVAVISWMAGLLYLPRLLVYHCRAEPGSALSEVFKVMERRLLRAITTPAMIASWGLGIWLAWILEPWGEAWFWSKIVLLVILTGFHMRLAKWVGDFARDRNERSERFYRIANEVPTLLMIGIVVAVVVRPFS